MLSTETKRILNDPELIAKRDAWFDIMRSVHAGGGPTNMIIAGLGGAIPRTDTLYTEPEVWMEEALEELARLAAAGGAEKVFHPLAVWPAIYSTHFVAGLFGAEVFQKSGQWYNSRLSHAVGELKMPDWRSNEQWKLTEHIMSAFTAQEVALPLFAPSIPSSALNVAVDLYGAEVLIAMLEEPEAVAHDLAIINGIIVGMHRQFRKSIPEKQLQPASPHVRTQPPGSGHLCGCSSQLVSPQLYEKFIMSLDDAVLSVYPNGGLIHLCGEHRHLIPLFAGMKNLKSVQLNDRAAEHLADYVKGLREDQVIYLHPCPGMPLDRAKEIAGNRRMVICCDLNLAPGMKPEELDSVEARRKHIAYW